MKNKQLLIHWIIPHGIILGVHKVVHRQYMDSSYKILNKSTNIFVIDLLIIQIRFIIRNN